MTAYNRFILGLVIILASVLAGVVMGQSSAPDKTQSTETIYVVNHSQGSISDGALRADIPAWEKALNEDFAPVWGSPQIKIELTNSVPRGGIEALFVKNGPIRGALAYHTVYNGAPEIVVYAGVGDFYGYSNSVSFTHEAEELLADPSVSALNQGIAFPFVTLEGIRQITFPEDSYWIQEVADPVEAYSFKVDGVMISDFVTPNWWNDQVAGGFDYMGVLGEPYEIAKGGYAVFEVAGQFFSVDNFRHAGRDASGFMKGEKLESR